MNGRYKGETTGERLTQTNIKAGDCFQTRHDILGTNDADKGVPFSVVKSGYIGVCETAGGTADKVVTIQNMPDGFSLENGIEVSVYFVNGHTSTQAPTFNVNATGVIPAGLENQASGVSIGKGCWGAGVWLTLQYRKVTVSNTEIEKWIIKGHDVAEQDTSTTSGYTKYADGRITYDVLQKYPISDIDINLQNVSIDYAYCYYTEKIFHLNIRFSTTQMTGSWGLNILFDKIPFKFRTQILANNITIDSNANHNYISWANLVAGQYLFNIDIPLYK